MQSAADIISIRNVHKRFGAFSAVDDVSIDIAEGEFFSLLGASGCGKTTLLRMLAGFETPSQGDIVIDGITMTDVPPYDRPVNMVFQNYAIFPHLNVRDNIAYGLRKQKLSRDEQQVRVDEMLSLVQLEGYGERRANELSGGQRQRVALARALILNPRVLLLDEPLGALDKQLREQMQLELRRLQRSVGITFVFVTHDQEEALALSDRIAVMSDGHVLQVDTPDGLYERPKTRDVAGFIGNMNFIDGEVLSVADPLAAQVHTALGDIQLDVKGQSLMQGDKVQLAIRPEKIELLKHAEQGAQQATLEIKSYLGERSLFQARVPGMPELISITTQNAGRARLRALSEGAPIWLRCQNDAFIQLET